jgi:TonB-linked SusC/RagA family outer membrane protein
MFMTLLFINVIYAQNISTNDNIKGSIFDPAGEPVIGATVMNNATQKGIITDLNGQFTIAAQPGEMIVVSYVGFNSKTIQVGAEREYKIILDENTSILDEVVVIGYATQKKKLVTGATLQVDGNRIKELHTPNPLTALQSMSPGMQITKTSGEPGSSYKVYIRGMGTIGNADPLYIVDGIPGNIANINPADIKSIDVLKDAASAAIYGARAANGVVLITTHRGDGEDKVRIAYDTYIGFSNAPDYKYYLDATTQAMLDDEYSINTYGFGVDFAGLIPAWDKILSGEWKGTNWYKEIKNNNAFSQNHAISISGGNKKSSYFTSFSYSSQEGTLGKPVQTKQDRYTFRLNADQILFSAKGWDIVRLGETINFVYANKDGSLSGRSTEGLGALGMVMGGSPFMPVYDTNGDYHGTIPYVPQSPNPIALLVYNSNNIRKNYQLNANTFLTIEPIKNLVFRSSFGLIMDGEESRSYIPLYNLAPEYTSQETKVSQDIGLGFSRFTFENTLSYKFSLFEDKHNFDVLVGTTAEKGGLGSSVSGYNTNSIFEGFKYAYLINTPKISETSTRLGGSPWSRSALLSFFGRINYDYKETYMLSLIARSDGSSNFAPGKRWGFFPSVSAGWVISNETFMEPLKEYVNMFKLRASWGQNGNQAISPFQYVAKMRVGGQNTGDYTSVEYSYYYPGVNKDNYTIAAYPINLPNPEITWETSEQINVGFDALFLKNRLSFNFDWYRKTTKDWLVAAPVLASYGANAPDINGGNIKNTGVELAVVWRDQIDEFSYDINVNWAYNKNRVTRIANEEGIIHGSAQTVGSWSPEFFRAQVGYPIGYFWGVKTDGIFQNQDEIDAYRNSNGDLVMPNAVPGDVRYVNQNDDDKIDEGDRVLIGDPNPDGIFSFSFGGSWRGFDFRATFSGVYGNQIYGGQHDPLDRWRGEGTSNKWPRSGRSSYGNIISDLNLNDGDYIRLNDLTIGYDFATLLKKNIFSQVRLYITGQNLFTWTKYTGLDPEIGAGPTGWMSGIDYGFYPNARTFLFGLNLKF